VIGDGFLGRAFIQGTKSTKIPNAIHETLKYAHRASSEDLDIASNWLIANQPQVFINASGPSNVSESITKIDFYQCEPINLVRAHIRLLSRLEDPPTYIFVSSGAVYGNTIEGGSPEDRIQKPISPYGVGKTKAEEYLLNEVSLELQVIILRVFSTFSMQLDSRLPFVIRQKFESSPRAEFDGTGLEVRDFIDTTDIVSAASSIVSKKLSERRSIWNIGSGMALTVSEIVELAAVEYEKKNHGLKHSYRFNGKVREFDPTTLTANVSKLSNIGFELQVDPRAGLGAYFRQQKWL
jgi:nucleoside-diphosphate-sugar epimerase